MKKLALASAAALALLGSGVANAAVKDRPFFKVDGLVVVWGVGDVGTSTGVSNVVSDFYLLSSTSGAAGTDIMAGDVDGTAAVVTGSLDPITGTGSGNVTDADTDPGTAGVQGNGILDAADTFSTFVMDATTDVNALGSDTQNGEFFVASNTAFDIYAEATTTTADQFSLANIIWDMTVDVAGTNSAGLAYGAQAQHPGSTTAGSTADGQDGVLNAGSATPTRLTAFTASPTKAFDGAQRTAKSIGRLAEHSVRFATSYTFDADTSTDAADSYDLSAGTGTIEAEVTYTIYTP